MDNLRFLLFAIFATLLYMLWHAWQVDYGPKPEQPPVERPSPASTDTPVQDDVPAAISTGEDSPSFLESPKPESEVIRTPTQSQKIEVLTNLVRVEIDVLGGTVTRVDLLKYPVSKQEKETPVTLISDDSTSYYVAQTGILSNESSAPTHHSVFQSEKYHYVLPASDNRLKVPLTWKSDDGIIVNKIFTFYSDGYQIDIEHLVSNRSNRNWKGRQYAQLQRKALESDNDSTFIRTYTGGVIYNDNDKYKKISFEDMYEENLSVDAIGGWSAIIQHYFLSAFIPPADHQNHYYTKSPKSLSDHLFMIGSYARLVEIKPGQKNVFEVTFFSGPKIQEDLEPLSPGLELTVDYGFLTIIAKPIFWLLSKFYSFIGNWGWSIICVTFVIKLFFFKLSETSYRSMAKMRKIQPKMQAIRDRCADDKQRMNQEIMALYKKERVNPLGGCFPILVQIPVFISLYWVLLESVELRQAPFMLWWDDLSLRDPYFVLPLLMGVSMWIQQRLNPAPIDPLQEKVMKMFPFIFTIFFMFFPAGLVLYWVVNNSLSIVQQWYITNKIEAGESV